jgi:hypothetical protein
MPADTASDDVGDDDTDGEPQGMAEGGGIEREVGAQDGLTAGEAEAPVLRGFTAVKLAAAGRAGVGSEFDGGGELSGQGVELAADVGAGGGESGGRAGGIGRAQAVGEFAKFV